MYDYSKKSTQDGEITHLGVWHQAVLKLHAFDNQAVLDIGCGSGSFLQAVAPKAQKVLGVDPNPHNITALRKHNIPGLLGYLEDNEGNCQGYTIITCFEVIEHLYSPTELFRTIYNLLPPGGQVIVTTPNAFHLLRTLRFAVNQEHHDPLLDPSRSETPEHIRLWSSRMLSRSLTQAGFTHVQSYGVAHLFGSMRIFKSRLLVERLSQHLISIATK